MALHYGKSTWETIRKDFRRHYFIYLMFLPVLAYYIIFSYLPMYGVVISFQDFSPYRGVFGSAWVGLKHFREFFGSIYIGRLIRNTLLINVYSTIFGFPAPIILALMLNEVKNSLFKRTVQTISYLPHFVSTMVICGIIIDFTTNEGLINDIIALFGGERISFLMHPQWFRPVYVASGIWQEIGWGSIIYLAAISGIDQELYQSAIIDGAGRWKQMWHVTIPGIANVIIILLIFNFGGMMSVGFEKVFLLYTPSTYETADVISTYVYRKGVLGTQYGFATAVDLFNSIVNFCFLFSANWISRRVTDKSLW